MMTALYSYIDTIMEYELAILDRAPDGLVIQVRDMVRSDTFSMNIPKEEIPELAYVLMNIAKEIVLPQQRLLT
jgi:hypothetical protein